MSKILNQKLKTWGKTFYDDTTIYYEHLETLLPGRFLVDNIIAFYFLYLKHEKQLEGAFINPTLSYMLIVMDDEDFKDTMASIIMRQNLKDQNLIFLPVNDNQDTNIPNGGSHWSLLVYHKNKDIFYHYDSANQYNKNVAKKLYNRIKQWIGTTESAFELRKSPQQKNGNDCGLFVCATAEALANSSGNDENIFNIVNQESVSKMRKQILDLIDEKL